MTAEHLAAVTKMEHPFAVRKFSEWLQEADDLLGFDVLDIFYWEQRAGSWFASNCLEFDSTWRDVFIPYNGRMLLVDMLSADIELRKGPPYPLYVQLMRHLWPEVLSEPINPRPRWRGLRRIKNAVVRRARGLI
jgi:hypothetical protein